jgi:hypothetical protein
MECCERVQGAGGRENKNNGILEEWKIIKAACFTQQVTS